MGADPKGTKCAFWVELLFFGIKNKKIGPNWLMEGHHNIPNQKGPIFL